MAVRRTHFFANAWQAIHAALNGPQALAFIPAVILGGYWLAGEQAMVFLALGLPAAFALANLVASFRAEGHGRKDVETGLALRGSAEARLTRSLSEEDRTGQTAAALAIGIDDFDRIRAQFGTSLAGRLFRECAARITSNARDTDLVVRLGEDRFGIALGPMRRADLETMVQIAARLQSALSEPFCIDGARLFATASVGFCLPGRAPARTGEVLLSCAEMAMQEAMREGRGAIRAYSPDMARRANERAALSGELAEALENGQIAPWFQPQVGTDDGAILGFEALARWQHPARGLIPARDFVPAVQEQGQDRRLFEIMITGALRALRQWDEAGVHVPAVSLNLSADRLRDPRLPDLLQWELDRFEVTPERLRLEVEERAIVDAEDEVMTTNLRRLSETGFAIDLDNFGNGHASMNLIHRFDIRRIKIDRSYVICVDRDKDQQAMVQAILNMAAATGLKTLAEGVETPGEHAMLAQLGCDAVQGFAIARPMPAEQVAKWVEKHSRALPDMPVIASGTRR